MVGYIFKVTNKRTGETFIGKNYSVAFNKNYVGEEVEPEIQKYGISAFEVKMIMPYERIDQLDDAFEEMKKSQKKVVIKEEEPVEEKPKKRRKKSEEE